jgi:Ca2+-binding EF-hand superfamily protein
MNSGTIGDGVSSTVIKGMEEVLKLAAENYKNAALQYFSKKVTTNNFSQLQKLLGDKDPGNSGYITNSEFKRCLSGSLMKVTETEVEKLIEELDKDKSG